MSSFRPIMRRLDEDARVGLLHEVLGVLTGAAQRPGGSIEPIQVVAECVTLELGVTLPGPSQKWVRNNQPPPASKPNMHPSPRTLSVRRTAALVAATAAAALAIPAAANAAVTGAVTGDTATLTGDAANDNIIISVSGDKLRHNLAGFNSNIDFDSATAGDQTLTAAAGRLTINGGGGDDIIVGGPNLDTLRGGDRQRPPHRRPRTTRRTSEQIDGDAGNDMMIWNNGDGNDINEGGDGVDETQINNGTARRR